MLDKMGLSMSELEPGEACLGREVEFLPPAPTPPHLANFDLWVGFPAWKTSLPLLHLSHACKVFKAPLPPKAFLIPTEQNLIALVTCTIPILQFSFLENDDEYSFMFILSLPI